MGKLFIFGIGGTGSRVIKALSFLLASGVKIDADEVVPIIIDPDRANGDLTRTLQILKYYQQIHNKIEFKHNHFFQTKITTLRNLVDGKDEGKAVSDKFRFELKGIQNQKFKDFIDYSNLDDANKALVSALFSESNLDSDMEVGFKGNPNIGSVVLNQFKDSDEFIHFASNFNENDRIFIISSIFGGTGAAGFPLLLKNIRNAKDGLPHHHFLQNARIGAVTLLPYFGVAPDENSEINKATFISKTQAALHYYNRNISGSKSLNALYYLGDKLTRDYENNEGSLAQKNDAHFIEMTAALSIIDFMAIGDDELITKNAQAESPKVKEFGIKNDADPMIFSDLGNSTQIRIKNALVQFKYFCFYLEHQFEKSLNNQPWSNKGNVKIDSNFASQTFFNDHVRNFTGHFNDWIKEMGNNKRAFSPFNLAVDSSNLFKMVEGFTEKRVLSLSRNFALYDDRLNSAESHVGDIPAEQKFFAMFHDATEKILQEKFNF